MQPITAYLIALLLIATGFIGFDPTPAAAVFCWVCAAVLLVRVRQVARKDVSDE